MTADGREVDGGQLLQIAPASVPLYSIPALERVMALGWIAVVGVLAEQERHDAMSGSSKFFAQLNSPRPLPGGARSSSRTRHGVRLNRALEIVRRMSSLPSVSSRASVFYTIIEVYWPSPTTARTASLSANHTGRGTAGRNEQPLHPTTAPVCTTRALAVARACWARVLQFST